jgi:glycosyltransferase involved in cell wall biosynthesis
MSASSVGVTDDGLGIVHVTAPAPVGGLERVIQALAIGQHRDGHRVLVIGVVEASDDAHPFFAPLQEAGVAFEAVTLPGRAYLRERREVRAILERERPDIVHTHGYRSDLLDGPVARSLGMPIVSTVHGSSRMGGLSHLFEWMQRRAWRRFDGVVVVSKSLEADMRSDHAASNNLALIPNAWPGTEPRWSREEARRHLGLDSDVPVIAFVGRLIPAKGPDLFVEALSAVADQAWQAVIVGDGGKRAELERLVRDHGLEHRVRLLGHQDDATQLFPAFDVFVLSSRTEGTPIVLFEAMAARVPVVVSAVGGVPDVISESEGWVVPTLQPQATAEALRTVLANPAEAARRACAARDRLERQYGTRNWLDRHDVLYRRLVAGARAARRRM